MSEMIYRHEAIRTIASYNGTVDKSVAKRLLLQMPSAEQDRHICRNCKWVKFYGNVDKNGNVESMWFCTNWDGVTDEEGFCHEWESR